MDDSASARPRSARRNEHRLALRREKIEAYLSEQNWLACEEACRALLHLAPDDHFALETLASTLIQGARNEEAASVLGRLVELSPRDPWHRMRLATVLQAEGAPGAALLQFERLIQLHPNSPFAHDASEAVENLDRLQTAQALMLATENDQFRWHLERDPRDALEAIGFQLSDSGFENLRGLLPGLDTEPPAPRMH